MALTSKELVDFGEIFLSPRKSRGLFCLWWNCHDKMKMEHFELNTDIVEVLIKCYLPELVAFVMLAKKYAIFEIDELKIKQQ